MIPLKPSPGMKATDSADVITFLLTHGADINALDNYGQTPLIYASIKGNMDALSILLNWPGIDLEVR